MKQKLNLNLLKLVISCGILIASLSGCGKTVAISIQDNYTTTQLETSVGKTVKDILAEAEISIADSDEVTPALNTKVEEDAEIVILRHATVQVKEDDNVIEVELTGKKVKDALDEAGTAVDENDYVNHNMDAYLTDGMSILVVNRVNISATVAGQTQEYLTEAKTVEEFLELQGIKVAKNDRITPKLSSKLKEGTKVVVKKTDVKEIVETEEIKYDTTVKYSDSMDSGTSKVTTTGKNGEKKVTYRVTYVDGEEESREVIKEEVVKEPVSQVITKGTKKTGKEIVSKEKVYDCDGSGHGYYIITYADGSVKYEDF